jgi:hypothetical protein
MKTLTFLIILSLVLAANAQNFYYGLEGGVNFADLDLKASSGTDQLTSSQTGFAFGGIFGHTLNNTLSLEVEVMYLQKGATQMANSTNPNIDIYMSVLEIPLFVKASFGDAVRPYVKAGPSLGFILSSEAETEYGGTVAGQSVQTYQADLNNVLKNIDVGLSIAAGVSFLVGNSRLFIEGRYSQGLVDLYKGGQIEWRSGDDVLMVEANEAAELYTKGIQLMVGITFPHQ